VKIVKFFENRKISWKLWNYQYPTILSKLETFSVKIMNPLRIVQYCHKCQIFSKLLNILKTRILSKGDNFSEPQLFHKCYSLSKSVASLKFLLFLKFKWIQIFQINRNFLILKIWNYVKFLGIYQFTTRFILYFINEHCINYILIKIMIIILISSK